MPKGDDGVMDNLDSRVERVEGFSRKERKGRKDDSRAEVEMF